MLRRIITTLLVLSFVFNQTGFIYAAGEINLSGYFNQLHNIIKPDIFRPIHLRYFSYDNLNNSYKILLDKGDQKDIREPQLKTEAQELLDYFLIGVTLPNDTFWVNLRPDAPENIIDPLLERTDIGKVFLEADLQLKKDTASFTSPQTPEGKAYWDKLYKRAGELFGTENITIPTITRPWIVPNEIIVRETDDSAYVYKATLKVLLEEDYLSGVRGEGSGDSMYKFSDSRLKEINEYSTQLIRETIIPKLTKEVNSSQRYAKLRQVYYSLILSRWFKMRFQGKSGQYASLIDRNDLTNLASKENWDKITYFNQYKDSFNKGEYNIKEPTFTVYGQSIRSYTSGGIDVINNINFTKGAGNPVMGFKGNNPAISEAVISGKNSIILNENLQVIEQGPLVLAASPLVANTEIPKLLEGWPIFESIEMLAQSTNQPAISFETDVYIGKKAYKLIKASTDRWGQSRPLNIKFWTIELLENTESKDPVVRINVYRNGTFSAMTPKLSYAERDKIVAVVKTKFFLDTTQMAELEKKSTALPMSSPITSDEFRKDMEEIGRHLRELDKIQISLPDKISFKEDISELLFQLISRVEKMQSEVHAENVLLSIDDQTNLTVALDEVASDIRLLILVDSTTDVTVQRQLYNHYNYILDALNTLNQLKKKLNPSSAGSPLGKVLIVNDEYIAKKIELRYVQYDELEEYHKKAIKELIKKTVFGSEIDLVSTGMDAEAPSIGKRSYSFPVVTDSMLDRMHFAIKAPRSQVESVEGMIGDVEGNGKITSYGKTLSIATAIRDAWKEGKEGAANGVSLAVVSEDVVSPNVKRGGIDMTDKVLHSNFERWGSLADIAVELPKLSNVEAIDLDDEYKQIQAIATSGIRPSDMRILEFITACYYKGEFSQRLGEITACLKEAHAFDERLGKESSQPLLLATLLPDALYAYSLN